jgi:uncharacterized membrane protein
MPETAAFCPGCGRRMAPTLPAQGSAGIFPENVAGVLAYLTFLPAILFLILGPYKRNRFVRFHSVQCLLLWAAGVLAAIALKLIAMLLFMIAVAGPLLVVLISVLASLAIVVIWLVLVVKAFQGEMFKVPVLGEFAERYACPT